MITNKLSRLVKRENRAGFTLLETLVSTGIASIILTSALGVVASIYYSQKKVQFSHDFFAEGRFLMERISQLARNNTIDFDRYFEVYGPGAGCSNFRAEQVAGTAAINNNATERAQLPYDSIFYWDTDGNGDQDRNLGGKTIDSAINTDVNDNDLCTQAFVSTVGLERLFLINSTRSMRIEIRHDPGPDFTVSMLRQLGADTDGDGRVDTWGPLDLNDDGDIEASDLDVDVHWTGSECQLLVNTNTDSDYADANEAFTVAGDATTKSWCEQAHTMQVISPLALEVQDLTFDPSPSFDPYLAFRNDQAQIQPQVFINLNLELRNPDRYGFEVVETPVVDFQTTVSSRVFGNIRR